MSKPDEAARKAGVANAAVNEELAKLRADWNAAVRELSSAREEIARLATALGQAGAALQNLDLESDYYVDGTKHHHVKGQLVTTLATICAALPTSREP